MMMRHRGRVVSLHMNAHTRRRPAKAVDNVRMSSNLIGVAFFCTAVHRQRQGFPNYPTRALIPFSSK